MLENMEIKYFITVQPLHSGTDWDLSPCFETHNVIKFINRSSIPFNCNQFAFHQNLSSAKTERNLCETRMRS